MSMIGHLVAVTPERLEELGQLGRGPDGEALAEALDAEFYETANLTFLAGKDWHLFHYLLNGDPWRGEPPLGLALGGCAEHLCEHDPWGYGPPMYLWPDEVRQVANALLGADRGRMRKRFTPAKLARHEIYSTHDVTPENEEAEWARVMEGLDELVAFYRDAAREGQAVVVWIS
jgi:hypothetical protein